METYSTAPDPNPPYISSLSSPMRKRHKDSLLIKKSGVRFWWTADDGKLYNLVNQIEKEHFVPFWLWDRIMFWKLCCFQGKCLRCVGWGHCCCQHLLWQGNRHGWELYITRIFIFPLFFKSLRGASGYQKNLHIFSPFPEFERIFIFLRVWEEHQDGPGGVHRLSWRSLWPLPWIQHHLLHWDSLLDRCWTDQKYGQKEGKNVKNMFCPHCTMHHKVFIQIH